MSPLPRSTAPSIALRSAPVRSSKKPEMEPAAAAAAAEMMDVVQSQVGRLVGRRSVASCLAPSVRTPARPPVHLPEGGRRRRLPRTLALPLRCGLPRSTEWVPPPSHHFRRSCSFIGFPSRGSGLLAGNPVLQVDSH